MMLTTDLFHWVLYYINRREREIGGGGGRGEREREISALKAIQSSPAGLDCSVSECQPVIHEPVS